MKLRYTTEEDYPELVEWWNWHRWKTPPTKELLDNLKHGLMVSKNNENICAGFIYYTNANAFALVEFIVSSHKIKDKVLRKEALAFLIQSLSGLAEKFGVKIIFTYVKNQNLINHNLKCGYVESSKNITEMIKIL